MLQQARYLWAQKADFGRLMLGIGYFYCIILIVLLSSYLTPRSDEL